MFTYFANFSKKASRGVLLRSDSEKFVKFIRNLLLWSSSLVAGIKAFNFTKKDCASTVFMVSFWKIFRLAFLQEHLWTAASIVLT